MSKQDELENLLIVEGINGQGFGTIAKIPMRDKRLKSESKAIYAYIASFAGSGTTAFPSASLMMSELNLSEDRFYKYRKKLVDLGYLEIIPRRKDGKRTSNLYKLVINPIEKKLPPENEGIEFLHPEFQGIENQGNIINSFISGTENVCEIDINLPFDMLDNDDLREFENSPKYTENEIQSIIKFVKEKFKGSLTKFRIDKVIGKVMSQYAKGKITQDLEGYMETSFLNEIEEQEKARFKRELKREAQKDKEQRRFEKENKPYVPMGIPFYNWLDK